MSSFFPTNSYSAAELAAEALDAASLQPCRHCQQLTPQQIHQVLHQLTPALSLVQARCQSCRRKHWLLLAG
ncbi:hypothetical protein [Hymenobacter jeollabukensis]|uniref:Uncharacterized protein n=1 Tax=Hymenobacter jeollabukensis TaxID=2025313 RepID=A0A5R8WIP2_9BACT|nr:hypothetical protein [Hymenobacter jeollabukensis]TLM88738.1 hypothetical protein FDY95_23175 [Hymenobacter jeollabukensis]